MQRKSVAIVTGASQGIGRATAIRLARDFEAVALAARQEDELENNGSRSRIRGRRSALLTHSICASPGRPAS